MAYEGTVTCVCVRALPICCFSFIDFCLPMNRKQLKLISFPVEQICRRIWVTGASRPSQDGTCFVPVPRCVIKPSPCSPRVLEAPFTFRSQRGTNSSFLTNRLYCI